MQKEGLSKCVNLKGSYARMSISDIKFMTVWGIFVFFLNLFSPFRKWVGLLDPSCFFYGKPFL